MMMNHTAFDEEMEPGELVTPPRAFGRLSPSRFLNTRIGVMGAIHDELDTSGTVDTEDDDGESSMEEHKETCFEGEYCLQLTPVGAVVKCRVQQSSNAVQNELLLEREEITRTSSLEDSGEIYRYVDSPRSLKVRTSRRQKRTEKRDAKRGARRKQRKRRARLKKNQDQHGHAFCLQLTTEGDVAICQPMLQVNVLNDENTEITDPTCFKDSQSVMSAHYALVNGRARNKLPAPQQKNRLTRGFCLQLTPQGEVVKCRSTLLAGKEAKYDSDIVNKLENELPDDTTTGSCSLDEAEVQHQSETTIDGEFCLQLTPVGNVVKYRTPLWEQDDDAEVKSALELNDSLAGEKLLDEGAAFTGEVGFSTPERNVKSPSLASRIRLSSVHEKLHAVMKTPEKKSYKKSAIFPDTPEKRKPIDVPSKATKTRRNELPPKVHNKRPVSVSPRKRRSVIVSSAHPKMRSVSSSPQKLRPPRIPHEEKKLIHAPQTPPKKMPVSVPSTPEGTGPPPTPQKTRPVNITPVSEKKRTVNVSLAAEKRKPARVPSTPPKTKPFNTSSMPTKTSAATAPPTPRKTRPSTVTTTPERKKHNAPSTPKMPQKSRPPNFPSTPERTRPVEVTPTPDKTRPATNAFPPSEFGIDSSLDDSGFQSGEVTELMDSDVDSVVDDMYMQLAPDGNVICCLSDSDSRRLHPVFVSHIAVSHTMAGEPVHRKPPLVHRLFGAMR